MATQSQFDDEFCLFVLQVAQLLPQLVVLILQHYQPFFELVLVLFQLVVPFFDDLVLKLFPFKLFQQSLDLLAVVLQVRWLWVVLGVHQRVDEGHQDLLVLRFQVQDMDHILGMVYLEGDSEDQLEDLRQFAVAEGLRLGGDSVGREGLLQHPAVIVTNLGENSLDGHVLVPQLFK